MQIEIALGIKVITSGYQKKFIAVINHIAIGCEYATIYSFLQKKFLSGQIME